MKKTYKIEVDCANCANKMEEATKNTEGVKDATVNFMTLKMNVEFEEWGIYHMLAIQHIDNRIKNNKFFQRIYSTLRFFTQLISYK